MKNDRASHYCLALRPACLLLAAIGLLCSDQMPASGQEVNGQRDLVVTPDRVQMRWKFETGDIFHWRSTLHLEITDHQNKQYQNEQICDYQWLVMSVDSRGTAILEITFDRIQDRSEWSGFHFDTRNDGPFTLFDGDDAVMQLIYKRRAMKASKMMVAVTSRGGVSSDLVGDECVEGSNFYAPGDMPVLPESELQVGGAWSVRTKPGSPVSESDRLAEYRLTSTERAGSDLICHLEGVTRSLIQPGNLLPSTKPQAMSTSRFNAELGHFESETLKSRLRTELEPGETASVRISNVRELLRRSRQDRLRKNTGQFIFSMDGKSPQPLVLNGVKVAHHTDLPESPRKSLLLEFYHQWLDEDQNGKPGPGELRGSSTRFSTDEAVQFLVDSNGLKGEKLYFVAISGDGTPLFRSDIAIKGNDWYSLLNVGKRKPGIYFFEFIFDEQHLIRVPIQVYTKLGTTIAQ